MNNFTYETVAASQTNQALGTKGGIGDYLDKVVVDTATGTVTVKDGATTVLTIPASGTGVWEVGVKSASGAWNITTAAATSCVCIGKFS